MSKSFIESFRDMLQTDRRAITTSLEDAFISQVLKQEAEHLQSQFDQLFDFTYGRSYTDCNFREIKIDPVLHMLMGVMDEVLDLDFKFHQEIYKFLILSQVPG